MVAVGYVGHDPTLVPKTTQVIAGSGLSGGGPLSTDVTLVNTGGGGGGVPSNRLINTTAPLTGGGDLSADRTLAVSGAAGASRGVLALAGDLGGTADLPTVPGLASKQPLDAGLTALAALTGAGFVIATGTDVYQVRNLQASDIPNLDAAKITTGVFSGNRLPLISTPNLISGAWYTVPGFGGTGTINPANNTAIFVCLVPLRDCTLTGFAVEITTNDSTGVVRFGLASDSGGVPGSWLNDFGTVVATSIAVVQPASTPNVALTAGTRYWLGVVGQGLTSGLALRSRNSSDPNVASTLVSTATPPAPSAIRNCITSTGWSGALSGVIGSLANSSGCALIARLT